MAFLQKEAGKAVTDCFESGLTLDNLLNCAVVQIQFYEAMQASLFEALPPTAPLQCESGCTACCHRKVACTITEAIGIAAGLDDREDDDRGRIQAAARLLHERTARLDEAGRIRSGLPCALLANGKCDIYGARPISCRATYSSDRAACEKLYFRFGFDTHIPHYELMTDAHGQILLGYGRALDRLGLDGGIVELNSTLAVIADDPGAIARYLAGEHPFEAAKLMPVRKSAP
ncbi:MAG: YkgJ family cysteine cluster protein [Aliidongia sp.]